MTAANSSEPGMDQQPTPSAEALRSLRSSPRALQPAPSRPSPVHHRRTASTTSHDPASSQTAQPHEAGMAAGGSTTTTAEARQHSQRGQTPTHTPSAQTQHGHTAKIGHHPMHIPYSCGSHLNLAYPGPPCYYMPKTPPQHGTTWNKDKTETEPLQEQQQDPHQNEREETEARLLSHLQECWQIPGGMDHLVLPHTTQAPDAPRPLLCQRQRPHQMPPALRQRGMPPHAAEPSTAHYGEKTAKATSAPDAGRRSSERSHQAPTQSPRADTTNLSGTPTRHHNTTTINEQPTTGM